MLIYTLKHHYHLGLPPTKVLGDDSLFALPHASLDAPTIKSFFAKFGFVLSDKTVITNDYSDIIFLGHNFYGSRVTRDTFTCLSLALYTEEAILSAAATAVRLSSLVYDAGFNSFTLHNLYKIHLQRSNIDWTSEPVRPVSTISPFTELFLLG